MTLRFLTFIGALAALGLSTTHADAFYSTYPADSYCREYSETVIIGNRTAPAYGTACMQPDGSWQKITAAQPRIQDIIIQQPAPVYAPVAAPYPPYAYNYGVNTRPSLSINFGSYDYRGHDRHYRPHHWKKHDGHHRGHGYGQGHGRGHRY